MSSKVIKGILWQEDSYRIEVPQPEPEEEPESEDEESAEEVGEEDAPEEEKKPAFDEEAVNKMLAEIAAKEQKADETLKDAEAKAAAIREEAEADAEKLRADAKADAEKANAETEKLRADTEAECEALKEKTEKAAHEEGYKKGHEEGYKQGYDDGLQKAKDEMAAKIDDAVKKAEHTLQTAKEATNDYLVKAEQDFVNVILRVTEKIIPQHFIDAPQVILPAVRQALMKVRDQKEITVHVAPACYDFVLMARDEFRSLLTGGNATLEITADESLQPGDCILETPNGSVDARLQTQLEVLQQAVKDVLSKQEQ